MKGTKKLKRILAVMTAATTMAVMFSITAMAAPEESDLEAYGGTEIVDSAPSESIGSFGPDGNYYPPSYPDDSWNDYPSYPEYPGEDYPISRPEPAPSESYHKSTTEETYEDLYIIEEQTEHSYVRGSGAGVVITSNGEYSKFFSVFIDGVFLEKNYYTVERGSTVLTLMPEYLDTLPVGAHTVTMNYTYGSVDSVLNIEESGANAQNVSNNSGNNVANQAGNNASAGNNAAPAANSAPKTGDTSAILLWLAAALASGCGCAVLVRKK